MTLNSESSLSRDLSVRQAYSADASGLVLVPDAVARPSSVEAVVDVLNDAASGMIPVTAASGQSSMTGGSITDRGILLSLRGMDRILELDPVGWTVRVEPGIGVAELKRVLAQHGLLFAPDPTSEEEACLGGAIACNASGARSLKYGATRRHVIGLSVVLASGELIRLKRSQLEKNTVGYAAIQDPIDWFIGSEGTLGVIVEAELSLLPLPERVVGLGFPFPDEAHALSFVLAARESMNLGRLNPRCLEFLDQRALEIVRAGEGGAGWLGGAFVYTEEESRGDQQIDSDAWLELAEFHGAQTGDILVFDDESKIRTARLLRHAVPATLNERGNQYRSAGGRRLATDWAVPYRRLPEAIGIARDVVNRSGIEMPVIYGHSGNGHPHMDFVAHDQAEVIRIENVIAEIIGHILAMGGTVAAEHGIGKVKHRWMRMQLNELQYGVMRSIKQAVDPNLLLGVGNIFPAR